MSKEYWVIVAVVFLILSSVLDSFAGPVQLVVGSNPFSFLSASSLSTYPFTAVAIGVRALGFLIFVLAAVSTIERQYFLKAVGLLTLGVLAELYAVQQLATGVNVTPVNYTLSISYAGAALVLPILIYLLKGVVGGIGAKIVEAPEESAGESKERIERIKKLSEG